MNELLVVAADVTAIAILAFGIYFPRRHRRDLVVAFLGVNIGVLAVSMVLGSTTVGAASDWVSSASCRSSGSARTKSPSTRSPTTSQRWPSACCKA